MMRIHNFFITLIIIMSLAGCGGQGPQLGSGMSDLNSSFNFGSSSTTKPIQNKLANAFWGMESLRSPLQAEEKEVSTDKNGDVEVVVKEITYEGERWEGSQIKVSGYFAYPNSNKGVKYPAIVYIHGSGQTASRDLIKSWASRGYTALSIDLPGGGPSRESSKSTGPDMTDENIIKSVQSAKESWLYPAVCSVIRGISVISNRPNVDASRVGIVGSGWGGVIAIIVNGVDNRVRAACSIYGSGYIDDKSAWSERLKKMPEKQRKMWMEAFDPSRYAKSQNGAVLYLSATGEPQYPLSSFAKTVKDTTAEKRCAITPNAAKLDDLVSGDTQLWFDWALKSGQAFPKAQVQVKGDKVTVIAKGGRPAVKAVLYYRPDTGDKWESIECKPDKGAFSFTLPSGIPSYSYFVSIVDDRNGIVSSEPISYRVKDVKTASNRR